MDPATLTLLSVIGLMCSYYVGHHFGRKEGNMDAWLELADIIGAQEIEIDQDKGKIKITYLDGSTNEL